MSVVMPIRNGEAHVEEQLAALAAQTYGGTWELVVVDNGCSDSSMEIVERWRKRLPCLTVVDAAKRRGLNYARNRGAAEARGAFLAFCDSDDVAEPEWLEGLVQMAPHADVVAGRHDTETLNSPEIHAWSPAGPDVNVPVRYGFLPSANGGNCGIWTSVAREIGWDETFTYGAADIEFSWRAQLAGHTIVYAPGAVMRIRHRQHLRALMRQYISFGKSEAFLFRRFRGLGMPSPRFRDVLRSWWWLLRRSPDLLRSRARRGHWVRLAALAGGRLLGSIRWGALYLTAPRQHPTGPHLIEFGVRWPPETFVTRRLERLSAAGFRVTVASLADTPGPHAPPAGVDHVPVIRPDWSRLLVLASAVKSLALLAWHSPRRILPVARAAAMPPAAGAALSRRDVVNRFAGYARLAALKPDLVHFEWSLQAVRFSSLADALGSPYVVSCHGSDVQVDPYTVSRRPLANALPGIFEGAAAVHCVSEAVATEAARFGAPASKTSLIRAAVDPTFFCPAGSPEANGRFPVVAIGTLRWLKGFEYTLLAVAELAREGVPVSLDLLGREPDWGEPSDRERLLAAIADLGLEGKVRLHGWVSPAGIRDRLRACAAYLQSSLCEGHPTAVVEAMACEVPIVATDSGGTREVISDGVEGFLVAPRDWRAAAAALRLLWEEPELRKTMGQAGRARVQAEFTLDRQTERFMDFYEKALERCS